MPAKSFLSACYYAVNKCRLKAENMILDFLQNGDTMTVEKLEDLTTRSMMKRQELVLIEGDITRIYEMMLEKSNGRQIAFHITFRCFDTGDAYFVTTDETGQIQEDPLVLSDIKAPPAENFSFVCLHVLVMEITAFTYKQKNMPEQTALRIYIQDATNDEAGLVVWSNLRRTAEETIRWNRTYLIHGVKVSRAKTAFNGQDWNIEITQKSFVEDVTNTNPIAPRKILVLACFDDILSVTDNSTVSVKAIPLTVGDVRTFPKDDSTCHSLVYVTLMDQHYRTIMLGFWNTDIPKVRSISFEDPLLFSHLVI
jgi:hypothetical protein